MNTDSLRALRDRGPKPRRTIWTRPTLADFPMGRVMAFDPSLSGCSVVMLHRDFEGLHVIDADTFRTPTSEGKGGREHDLRRSSELRVMLRRWWRSVLYPDKWTVVYEGIGEGPFLKHIEASLLAADQVRTVGEELKYRFAESIAARTHKHFVCGNANAKKHEEHEALREIAEELSISDYSLITNEDKRDALCVALCALSKGVCGG